MPHSPDRKANAEPIVTVFGEASVRAEPDEAIVWITLTAVADAPGPALADVAERSETLVTLLDELAIAREERSTTGITVREEFEHTNDGPRRVGHRATATVSIRVSDTEAIGRVIMRTSAELDASIAGPSWRISADNPARLAAATEAAGNASKKAEAYAAGVGARLGPLVALAESGEPRFGGLVAASGRVSAGPELQVDAGEQEVGATIQATFVLLVS
jgi:hypothetical protein